MAPIRICPRSCSRSCSRGCSRREICESVAWSPCYLVEAILKCIRACCKSCCRCMVKSGGEWTRVRIFGCCLWVSAVLIAIFLVFTYLPSVRDGFGEYSYSMGRGFMEASRVVSNTMVQMQADDPAAFNETVAPSSSPSASPPPPLMLRIEGE